MKPFLDSLKVNDLQKLKTTTFPTYKKSFVLKFSFIRLNTYAVKVKSLSQKKNKIPY
jgi:hypothetical protein